MIYDMNNVWNSNFQGTFNLKHLSYCKLTGFLPSTWWLCGVARPSILLGSMNCSLFPCVLTLWARPTFWQSDVIRSLERARDSLLAGERLDTLWRGESRGQGSPILENVTDQFIYVTYW